MALFSLLNRFWRIILVAAILKWMSLHVWLLNTWFGVDLRFAIWDSVVSNLLLMALTLTLINIVTNYVPSTGKFWFALGLSFFLSWFAVWLISYALTELSGGNEVYGAFIEKALPLRWVSGFLILAGASVSSVFYYMLNDQRTVVQREAETTSMMREAELQKLQLQLQPHFLFNSLNSINAMILSNADEARKMVERLSEFLRITTKRADEQRIRFSDEWTYLQLYLDIEKVRFGHRLEVKSEIARNTEGFMIPTMVLQPLVENAIKFGLYGTVDKVLISIESSLEENMLVVRIENPFDPDSQPQKGSGFGLSGLKRRLYLLFARNDLLQYVAADNRFVVTLRIPK